MRRIGPYTLTPNINNAKLIEVNITHDIIDKIKARPKFACAFLFLRRQTCIADMLISEYTKIDNALESSALAKKIGTVMNTNKVQGNFIFLCLALVPKILIYQSMPPWAIIILLSVAMSAIGVETSSSFNE